MAFTSNEQRIPDIEYGSIRTQTGTSRVVVNAFGKESTSDYMTVFTVPAGKVFFLKRIHVQWNHTSAGNLDIYDGNGGTHIATLGLQANLVGSSFEFERGLRFETSIYTDNNGGTGKVTWILAEGELLDKAK